MGFFPGDLLKSTGSTSTVGRETRPGKATARPPASRRRPAGPGLNTREGDQATSGLTLEDSLQARVAGPRVPCLSGVTRALSAAWRLRSASNAAATVAWRDLSDRVTARIQPDSAAIAVGGASALPGWRRRRLAGVPSEREAGRGCERTGPPYSGHTAEV